MSPQREETAWFERLYADVLDLPDELRGTFDLVAEAITAQALPVSLRASRRPTRSPPPPPPGGTLVVVWGIHEGAGERDGPPWPLTRPELDRFERTLRPVEVGVARLGAERRWLGEYVR